MAKSVIILASALCLLSCLGASEAAPPHFAVTGKVYCDTCRTQFLTRASYFLSGAKVRLECETEDGVPTYSSEGVTDESGSYSLKVEGDHEEEICEVLLVSSPDSSCSEIPKGEFLRNSAKVSLTSNNGIRSDERDASPLGFLKNGSKKPAECLDVLKELELSPEDIF